MFKYLLNFVGGEQGSITQLAGRVSSRHDRGKPWNPVWGTGILDKSGTYYTRSVIQFVGSVSSPSKGYSLLKCPASILVAIVLLSLLAGACAPPGGPAASGTQATNGTTTSGGPGPSFPTTPPQLRTPAFATTGQEAPTVKVLASVDPTLIIQFPLVPSGIKTLFPNAKGLVTVFQNPNANDFDTVTVDVQNMPPNVKFTVFFTEIAAKPFGHAEYVGDVITRGDGTGESVFHLITFVAFAADNRNPGTSTDQSGEASGIQLEHVGMWFDGVANARKVLNDPSVTGTPFDGGGGALHAGPQAMTDGQTLPVI